MSGGTWVLRISERPFVTLTLNDLACQYLAQRIASRESEVPQGEVEAALIDEEEISNAGADEILEAAHTSTPEEAACVDVAHVSGV